MKQIKFLFLILASFGLLSSAFGQTNQELLQKLKDLEDRMSEVELNQSTSTIHWSGSFVNRFEYFDHQYGPTAQEHDTLKTFAMGLQLNAEGDITNKVSFYTTIGMSKFWNNDGRDEAEYEAYGNSPQAPWQRSMTGSSGLNGATPVIDRAYLQYKFDIPASFSIGRMPTNNGPPIEKLDGLARTGTYPRFAYNAIFDGMAFVYDFKNFMPKDHSLKMRVFYMPFMNVDPQDRTKQLTSNGEPVASYNPQYTVLTEYDIVNRLGMDRISLKHFLYDYRNFWWTAYSAYESAQANMGFIGLEGIAGTGLDLSMSWLNVFGYTQGTPHINSNAYLITANYRLPKYGNTNLGFEYINTDKNYYLDEATSLNLIPFYRSPKANGYHYYVSKPLGNNLTGRVGAYFLEGPADSGLAIPKREMYSYYSQLRFDF